MSGLLHHTTSPSVCVSAAVRCCVPCSMGSMVRGVLWCGVGPVTSRTEPLPVAWSQKHCEHKPSLTTFLAPCSDKYTSVQSWHMGFLRTPYMYIECRWGRYTSIYPITQDLEASMAASHKDTAGSRTSFLEITSTWLPVPFANSTPVSPGGTLGQFGQEADFEFNRNAPNLEIVPKPQTFAAVHFAANVLYTFLGVYSQTRRVSSVKRWVVYEIFSKCLPLVCLSFV